MRVIISGGWPGRSEDLEAARAYSPIISFKIIAISDIHHLSYYVDAKLRYESGSGMEKLTGVK